MPNHVARRVVRRGHRGFVGLFASRKSVRPIQFESLLEYKFLCLAEVDPLLTDIREQPREITWTDFDGVVRRHIPDFEVVYRLKPVITEVKPAHKTIEPTFKERTTIITSLLGQEGVLYRVLTEAVIYREPALSNAKVLLRGLGHDPLPEESNAVASLLAAAPEGMSIIEICRRLSAPPEFSNSIYAMIMAGQIALADSGAPVDVYARVQGVPNKESLR